MALAVVNLPVKTPLTLGVRHMKKMLAAAAILSLSLTGAAWAQSSSDSSDSPGGSDSDSQQEGNASSNESPSDNSAGDEPQCPPGQKSVDPAALKSDPKCVAE